MRNSRASLPLTIALCGGYFLVLLDVTVVNLALPRLGSSLAASGAGLAWVVDAYAVPLAALLLAAGAIGDRIGHRLVLLVGYLGFAGSSALCGMAPTIEVLVAGRALQGASAALMLPGTLALLVGSVDRESDRAHLVGLWAAVGGAALPAGPLVGGLLVQVAGWRSVFWLSVPIILTALGPILALPRPDAPRRVGPVDWAGTALVVLALGAMVTAVLGANTGAGTVIALASIATAAGLALCRVERGAAVPLLDVPRAGVRPLAASCGVAGLMNLCVLGSLFLLTQVLQVVHRLDPLDAGLLLLPAMLPLPLLGGPAGRLTARFGPWRTSAIGLLTAAVGFAAISVSFRGGPNYPCLLVAFAVWGSGIGVLTPAVVTAALQAVPASPGVASGASNASRQAGGALGVAAFGAIAGPSTAPGFAAHALMLLVASAAAFAVTALLCRVRIVRGAGRGPRVPGRGR